MVHPAQELVAFEHLKRQDFKPFHPQYEVTRVTRGRETTTKHPYFSGYMLIHFDRDDSRWRSINGTRGVRKLMMADGEMPARVRDSEVHEILKLCDERGIVNAAKVDQVLRAKVVPVGAVVKIEDGGPFDGHVGKVEWTKEDRVKVLLSLFGRPTPVEVSSRRLELV